MAWLEASSLKIKGPDKLAVSALNMILPKSVPKFPTLGAGGPPQQDF